MFLTPLDPSRQPGKRAWDNLILWDADRARFVAFFATATPSPENLWGAPTTLDVAVSEDGLRWCFLARDRVHLPGAHAGYGVHHEKGRFLYYPTCSQEGRGVHFKIFSSTDLMNWEPLGEDFDVAPDRRYYHDRWEEIMVLKVVEEGRTILYGYISSEVRPEVGPPGVGLLV